MKAGSDPGLFRHSGARKARNRNFEIPGSSLRDAPE
jgi:hypothetical protein